VSEADVQRRLRFARAICGRLPPFAGAKLADVLYPYRRGRLDAQDFTVRAQTGSRFTGNTADFHAHPLAVKRYGEWRNWAITTALCGAGDVVVEIGANVGSETVGYSDIVGATGRLVAFEPLPANLVALERIVEALEHRNVTLLPYALSDRRERTRFAVPPPHMSQGTGHLLGAEEKRTQTTIWGDEPVEMQLIDVECRTLDEFEEEVRGVRLVLADTEGAEVSILRGARNVLAADRPALVLEASHPHLRRAGLNGVEDLQRELESIGYRIFEIGRLDLEEVNVGALDRNYSHNWFCLPQERMELAGQVRRSIQRCGLAPCIAHLNPMTRRAASRLAGDARSLP
jgi:FkbM family methyltransferase